MENFEKCNQRKSEETGATKKEMLVLAGGKIPGTDLNVSESQEVSGTDLRAIGENLGIDMED